MFIRVSCLCFSAKYVHRLNGIASVCYEGYFYEGYLKWVLKSLGFKDIFIHARVEELSFFLMVFFEICLKTTRNLKLPGLQYTEWFNVRHNCRQRGFFIMLHYGKQCVLRNLTAFSVLESKGKCRFSSVSPGWTWSFTPGKHLWTQANKTFAKC